MDAPVCLLHGLANYFVIVVVVVIFVILINFLFSMYFVSRDAIIISLSDALTSIFSGFVVFGILGYMAKIQGKDVTDPSIATDGMMFVQKVTSPILRTAKALFSHPLYQPPFLESPSPL